MATISEIRSALATNLGNISGLRTSATVPDQINPPVAIVEPVSVEFDTAMGRGLDTLTFKVTVLVGRVEERTAQRLIDAYCSSSGSASIKSAIELDRTLGGKANDLKVTGLSSYGSLSVGDATYLAAEFAVTVYSN